MTSARFSKSFENAETNRPKTRKDSVVFLGSRFRFSQRLLDTFRSEFSWLDFKLTSNLSELSQLTSQDDSVVMVVVEEDRIDRLIHSSGAYFDAAGQARIIVAYCDAHQATKLISARKSSTPLKEIGFLPLSVQMDVWLSVMNLLLCGEVFYPAELIDERPVSTDISKVPMDPDANLTPREWEVLELVAQGLQNKNIASDLGLSQHTIKLHIHNLLKKIGVSNRTCAARWYDSIGLRDRGSDLDSSFARNSSKL